MTIAAYQHILAAVDFSPGIEGMMQRVVDLVVRYGARLSVIHVVEYLPVAMDAELMLPPLAGIEEQLMENARKRLEQFIRGLDMEVSHYVEMGSAKLEILRVAESQGVDLVVVGSHGRHGLARMLGSTASAILQGAHCDVLAVRTVGKV